jgi:hypothetical protein
VLACCWPEQGGFSKAVGDAAHRGQQHATIALKHDVDFKLKALLQKSEANKAKNKKEIENK